MSSSFILSIKALLPLTDHVSINISYPLTMDMSRFLNSIPMLISSRCLSIIFFSISHMDSSLAPNKLFLSYNFYSYPDAHLTKTHIPYTMYRGSSFVSELLILDHAGIFYPIIIINDLMHVILWLFYSTPVVLRLAVNHMLIISSAKYILLHSRPLILPPNYLTVGFLHGLQPLFYP